VNPLCFSTPENRPHLYPVFLLHPENRIVHVPQWSPHVPPWSPFIPNSFVVSLQQSTQDRTLPLSFWYAFRGPGNVSPVFFLGCRTGAHVFFLLPLRNWCSPRSWAPNLFLLVLHWSPPSHLLRPPTCLPPPPPPTFQFHLMSATAYVVPSPPYFLNFVCHTHPPPPFNPCFETRQNPFSSLFSSPSFCFFFFSLANFVSWGFYLMEFPQPHSLLLVFFLCSSLYTVESFLPFCFSPVLLGRLGK